MRQAQAVKLIAVATLLFGTSELLNAAVGDFASGKQPRRQIFVSPEGSAQGDGSRSDPLRDIGRAAEMANPGDAIRLLSGRYEGGHFIEGLRGTAESPIWLGGLPGEPTPVIEGGSQALHLSRVRYLIVENMEIREVTRNGINCDDGGEYDNPDATRNVIFRNLNIHDIGTGGNQDALKLSGVDDFLVMDCRFADGSAGGSGIDHVGCHSGVIIRCDFIEMGSNAIQCKGGSRDIEIRGNRFINGGQRAINIGGSTGFQFFRPPLSESEPNAESRGIRVISNLFQSGETAVAFVGTVDSLVANNTIITPRHWVLRILQETESSDDYEFLPSGNNSFINNLVYFRRADVRTDVNIGPNTESGSFRFSHNLWYAFDQPDESAPKLPVDETEPILGRDPQLVDPDNGDYSISSESPAVGAGIEVEGPSRDFNGNRFATPPSIGAFEGQRQGADRDGDQIPDSWEEANGLDPDDPTDAELDPDNDSATHREEYVAGTDPHNGDSTFRLRSAQVDQDGFRFRYPSQPGRRYRVEARVLGPGRAWMTQEVVEGTGNQLDYRQSSTSQSRLFRVGVELAH